MPERPDIAAYISAIESRIVAQLASTGMQALRTGTFLFREWRISLGLFPLLPGKDLVDLRQHELGLAADSAWTA